MTNIRPVSDLRNKFSEIEDIVLRKGEPVFLTKNGYGSTVLMSMDLYDAMFHIPHEDLEQIVKEAARTAKKKD